MVHWLIALTVWIAAAGMAWSATEEAAFASLPMPPGKPQADSPFSGHSSSSVIAVGFGYQRGTTSSIRIRTYDVQSGDLLSEDQFDLNVVNGENKDAEPIGDRVFAGAASLGVEGLGDFPMRVYEAKTGRFLWKGHLNLVDAGSDDPRHRIRGTQHRPATPRPARLHEEERPAEIDSHFLVQAVDAKSGEAVWQQTFQSTPPSPEAIAGGKDDASASGSEMTLEFEIVVRSYERSSGKLVWSDRLSTLDRMEEIAEDETVDRAQQLPLFPVRRPAGKVWVWEWECVPYEVVRMRPA